MVFKPPFNGLNLYLYRVIHIVTMVLICSCSQSNRVDKDISHSDQNCFPAFHEGIVVFDIVDNKNRPVCNVDIKIVYENGIIDEHKTCEGMEIKNNIFESDVHLQSKSSQFAVGSGTFRLTPMFEITLSKLGYFPWKRKEIKVPRLASFCGFNVGSQTVKVVMQTQP